MNEDTKVFLNGIQIKKQPRKRNGRYIGKSQLQKGVAIIAISLMLMCVGAAISSGFVPQSLAYAAPEVIDLTPQKIEGLKDELISTLAECESPGDTENTLPIIADNNKKGTLPRREIPSIGEMRFKIGTVMLYEKKRTGKELNSMEAVQIALDHSKARDLAKWIIFESGAGVENDWYTCSVTHDLERELKNIKKLDKKLTK